MRQTRGLDVITTTLKREWFAKIVAGTKRIEYREIKPYWTTRLKRVQTPFRACPAKWDDASHPGTHRSNRPRNYGSPQPGIRTAHRAGLTCRTLGPKEAKAEVRIKGTPRRSFSKPVIAPLCGTAQAAESSLHHPGFFRNTY